MQTYEPSAGTRIAAACRKAVALAVEHDTEVRFTFNGVALQAMPTDRPQLLAARWESIMEAQRKAYRESPEGKKAAAKRQLQITLKQASLDGLVAKMPTTLDANNLDEVVIWVRDVVDPADDVATKWNAQGVADQLEVAGYRENEHVGQKPEWFNTRERMGHYIIGQAINCMRKGMGPHPITLSFCEKYFKLPASCVAAEHLKG